MNAVLDPPVAPPASVEENGGGGSDWVELIRAANDIDAHLLAGRLHTSGIETRSLKDRSVPSWLVGGSDPWTPVAIFVRRFQLQDSRIVLAELSFASPAAAPAEVPPSVPRSHWRAAIAWWVAALVLGALFTGIGLSRVAGQLDGCSPPVACTVP